VVGVRPVGLVRVEREEDVGLRQPDLTHQLPPELEVVRQLGIAVAQELDAARAQLLGCFELFAFPQRGELRALHVGVVTAFVA
jgi:hypothetical protein